MTNTPLLPLELETTWLELSNYSNFHGMIAGVDEVGRGCLFGPVVSAAVILPTSAFSVLMTDKINDSKKLSHVRRVKLAAQIASLCVDWKIGYATTAEIDRLNILQASLLSMKRAVMKLKVAPNLCLIDGNQLVPGLSVCQNTIVKGDQRSLNIAAASIMAKVWRDDLIVRLAAKYPMYDIANNKGYGSKKHLMALQRYGPSPWHRLSFAPCMQHNLTINN